MNAWVRRGATSLMLDPVLYGDQNRVMFENTSFHHNWTAIISRVELRRLHINIGSLHGVCVEQVYTIYPQGAMDRSNPITTITIDSVHGDQASGKLESATNEIHEGCPADLTASKYAMSMHVIVQCSKLYEALKVRTNAGIVFHDNTSAESQQSLYKICCTDDGYRVVDRDDNPLPYCPHFPQETATADNILKFLRNIAHYNNVLNLGNDDTTLKGEFDFFERDGIRTVLDGDSICLLLQNLRAPSSLEMDKNNLHFSILNLTVDWKVEQVFPEQEEPNDVSPGKTSDGCLFEMSIPEYLGLDLKTDTITDIFKVIVTDRPCQFQSLNTSNAMRGAATIHEFDDLFEEILQGDEPLRQARRRQVTSTKWQTDLVRIDVKRRIPEN